MNPEVVIIGWALSIIASGIAAYVGVRIAIAQIQARLEAHEHELEKHEKRIDRLEKPYFAENQS